jgi:predicted SnoaL-like aldol condensation-catalyzing enzyme
MTVSRASLKLLSIVIGLLFTAAVYQTMHNNPRWDWTAPGVGKLPREIVTEYMQLAYDKGQGGTAATGYFAKDAKDNAAAAQDRVDGAPIPHEVRSVIGQGMTVIVVHRIEPARGEMQQDVIDQFEIKDGRIARRDRYVTRFDQ